MVLTPAEVCCKLELVPRHNLRLGGEESQSRGFEGEEYRSRSPKTACLRILVEDLLEEEALASSIAPAAAAAVGEQRMKSDIVCVAVGCEMMAGCFLSMLGYQLRNPATVVF